MKAMILAAGLGTRLRPLTDTTPKALLPVRGRPLIYYSLDLLKRHGITEVLVNLHHLGEMIEKELGDGRKLGMKISYSWELQVLGTGGGVKKGEAFFEGRDFIVMNSDILIDVDLKDLCRFHREKRAAATMVLKLRDKKSTETPVQSKEDGRIASIGTISPTAPSHLYTGVQVLGPSLLKYLPPDQPSCLIRQGYQPALAAGERIFGYLYEGPWQDVGTRENYRKSS